MDMQAELRFILENGGFLQEKLKIRMNETENPRDLVLLEDCDLVLTQILQFAERLQKSCSGRHHRIDEDVRTLQELSEGLKYRWEELPPWEEWEELTEKVNGLCTVLTALRDRFLHLREMEATVRSPFGENAPPPQARQIRREITAEELARREREQQLWMEEIRRNLEELRESNSQLVPPDDGMPLPPAPGSYLPVAPNPATPEPKQDSKKEKKGLFGGLLARKKQRKNMPKIDEVQFRAAAPASIRPGEYFPVKVMMYLEEDHARADREQQSLGDQVKFGSSSVVQAQQGQQFRMVLQSPDFLLMDCAANLFWNGKYAAADLDVLLPEHFDKKQLRLHGRVYSGAAVLTDVKMILQVDAPQIQEILCEKTVLRSAFVSYASADRAAVASRLQGMQAVAPQMDLFFDVEKLRRGERWEPRLYQEIQNRELFYLFWSRNAANSPWVGKELAYALEHKGPEYIEPVPLEAPDVCPPPAALQDRHFYDWTLRYTNK